MGSAGARGDGDYEREYAARRYRIGEFSAMTGMSASRIRFYEKEGLFPGRKEENGYRYFTPHDAFRANAFRVLLQYGFNVEQAIEMLDMRQGSAEFRCSLVAQREVLSRQAELLRYRTKRLDRALELLESAEGFSPDGNVEATTGFEVVDVEDWLYVMASRGSDFSVSTEHAGTISAFYELLNVTNCARVIARDDLLGEGPTLSPSYVIAMLAHESWRLAKDDLTRVERLVMGKCLRVRRLVTRAQSLRRESYVPALAYLEERGYRVRGDALLLPGFLNLDGEGSDVETLFIPIA